MDRRYFFPPLALPFFLLLFLLPLFLLSILLLFAFLGMGRALGFSAFQTLCILYASLLGSVVNIPVKEFERPPKVVLREFSFFGIRYSIPTVHAQKTILAVNLGGAVVPVLVAFYILPELPLCAFFIAFLAVVAISYAFSRVVEGVGVVVPAFIPPFFAALSSFVALLVCSFPVNFAVLPKLAFAAGVLGVLFGADILNLREVLKTGAPMVSIGGAGIFDGIFLTGVASVLLSLLFF